MADQSGRGDVAGRRAEIAFPVLLATMLADFALGFLARPRRSFPRCFLGISLKVLLGLAVLYGAVIGFWPRLLGRYFYQALTTMEHLLAVAR